MSVTLIQTGAFVLLAKYIYRKQSGIWYFRRRIPSDVLKHYPGRNGDIRFSLKTRDESEAASLANQHALGQDAQWTAIRTGQIADGPERVRAAEEILRGFGLKPGEGREIDEVGAGGEDFFAELDFQAGIDPMVTPEENIQRQQELSPEYSLAAKLLNGEPVPLLL
ncbi:MAG: DUF6538 domain-containing protein [Pseudomonadota bacterium]